MGIVDRLRDAGRALFSPHAEIRTSQDLASAIGRDFFGAGATASGESVSAERAMGVAAVYACVRLACNHIAHLPLVTYKRDSTGRREPDFAHPVYSLLHDRPNEWQTSFEWRELMQRDLELRGNAYSLIVRGASRRPQELLRLHPDRVTPKQDEQTLEVMYEYSRQGGDKVTYLRTDILHVRGMGDDGVKGKSPISLHRETVGDALAIQKHGSRFFSNGAKPLGTIQMAPGAKMGKEAQQRFRADWESTYAGGDNAHKTLLLPFGLEYKPVSVSMADAEYIDSRKLSVTEIARIFGMPPHKIADLERSTNNNIEHQGIEFVVDAMVPRANRWEQAIHRDLLDGDPSRYVKFNMNALLRGTAKERAEALQIQRRNGVINANDWRELEDMNRREDPGGNVYVIEANMQPNDGREAERLAKQATPQPEPPTDAPADDEG